MHDGVRFVFMYIIIINKYFFSIVHKLKNVRKLLENQPLLGRDLSSCIVM